MRWFLFSNPFLVTALRLNVNQEPESITEENVTVESTALSQTECDKLASSIYHEPAVTCAYRHFEMNFENENSFLSSRLLAEFLTSRIISDAEKEENESDEQMAGEIEKENGLETLHACLCTYEMVPHMAQQPQPIRKIEPQYETPTMHVPTSPNSLYTPPIMVPRCAFEKPCPKKEENITAVAEEILETVSEGEVEQEEKEISNCTDYASWGFSGVRQAKYTPNTRYLNQMRCFYFMRDDGVFTYPDRVKSSHNITDSF